MKIAFAWPYDKASEILPNWRDGLRAAIEIIEKDHQVDWYLDKKLPDLDNYDFVLVWDDSNSVLGKYIQEYKLSNPNLRAGLCLTTDPANIDNLRYFDVVYCESDIILEEVKKHGIRAIKAFGTDSNFFAPSAQEKTLEYFYPATFSPWKRQEDIAYLGSRLTCLGTIQPDGTKQYEACAKNNVDLQVGYFPAETIRDLYLLAKRVIIPAIHGSERTTLEAMSMNIPIETTAHTNMKVKLLLNEFSAAKLNKEVETSREFILKYYSCEKYAEALMKGMQ